MTTVTSVAVPEIARPSRGVRRWTDVVVLWVAAVAAQALILFLLAQYQLQQLLTWENQVVVDLVRRGQLDAAAEWSAEPDYLYYPTGALVVFGLVGLAVVVVAAVGRRSLALAMPVMVAIASLAPAYNSRGPAVPQPLSDLQDGYSWGALAVGPAQAQAETASPWPLLLGVAVQTGLLLLPLVAAPRARADLSLVAAVRRSALPTLAVAIVAVAAIPFPTSTELVRVPAAVALIGVVAAAIATGLGPLWFRLSAAVVVPGILGPVILPMPGHDAGTTVVTGIAVGLGAGLIALGTLATPWIDGRLRALRSGRPDATLASPA